MAAAAYKTSLTVVNAQGQVKSIPLGASDVNAAALTFPSAGTEISLSSVPCVIRDWINTAAGTDTTNITVFINGVNTGIVVFNALNLATTIQRQVASAPISIPGGALVKLVQNT